MESHLAGSPSPSSRCWGSISWLCCCISAANFHSYPTAELKISRNCQDSSNVDLHPSRNPKSTRCSTTSDKHVSDGNSNSTKEQQSAIEKQRNRTSQQLATLQPIYNATEQTEPHSTQHDGTTAQQHHRTAAMQHTSNAAQQQHCTQHGTTAAATQ